MLGMNDIFWHNCYLSYRVHLIFLCSVLILGMIVDKYVKLRLWNCRDIQVNYNQYDMPLKVFIFDPRKKGRVAVAFTVNGQLPVIDDSL